MTQPETKSNLENQNAFLIIDGKHVFVIDLPVINIGRKSDNHIVLDNEHVSRYHAQIRVVRDQYVLVDLNSTVGTSVNGNRIDRVTLKPGDVISLGGTPLIFGLGAPRPGPESSSERAQRDAPTGPTDATDIQSADQYLDLFNTPEED